MESLENLLIPIFGIIGVFGMPVFIVLIVSYFEQKKEQGLSRNDPRIDKIWARAYA